MIDQLRQIHEYIRVHEIKEYSIEERCNEFTHSITVMWVQDYIRCQSTIRRDEFAARKMKDQFELTKNLLKSNLK